MNVYNAGFLSVFATGVAVAATNASASRVAVPAAQDGVTPRFIRVAATQPICVKLGNSTVTATTGDLQVQPGDAVILAVGNQTHISAIAVATGGQVQVSALESI